MTKKIGVLLPYRLNDELMEFVEENLQIDAELSVAGSQDGLSDAELRQLGEGIAPGSYAEILADGSTIFLHRDTVITGMKKQARRLLDEGCEVVMLCCSLPTPELGALENVFTPGIELENLALNIASEAGTIGVMQPLAEAMDEEIQHWLDLAEQHGGKVVSVHAAPQVPGEDAVSGDECFRQAARSLAEQGADVIVLDCMSYTDEHRKLVAQESGKPVLRAMSVATNVIEQTFLK